MTTNVHEILEKARASGQRLTPEEASVLFAAAVRLASAQGATLRSRLVQLDEQGELHLAPFDDRAAELEPGYLAPELQGADAPRKSEPRVQVYAAGVLGYELLTGQAPGGDEPVPGPLGDLVRMALSPDRRERFGDQTQLYDAVEGVQKRLPAEVEKQTLLGIRTRLFRASQEREALARVIEKLTALEAAVTKSGAAQRQALERVDRLEGAQRRSEEAARNPPSAAAPAILGGILGAALSLGGAYALGMLVLGKPAPAPVTQNSTPVELPKAERAAAEPPSHEPVAAAPVPGAAAPVPGAAAPAPAAHDAGAVAHDVADAGAAPVPLTPASDAGPAAAVAADAGTALAVAPPADAGLSLAPLVAEPAAKPAPEKPEPAKPAARRRDPEVTQAAMVHAVALSQVRRGETALEKGRVDEAVASFKDALKNEPIATAWRGLGMAYAMQSNDSQALQSYEKYLQLSPGASDAAEIRRSIVELKARSRIGGEEK